MESNPTESSNFNGFDNVSVHSSSLNDDFSHLGLQQQQQQQQQSLAGGVGTTAYHDSSASSSFVSSPGIVTPAFSEDFPSSFVSPLTPATPTAVEPPTPETPASDQDTDSPSITSSRSNSPTKREYRCTWPKCRSKKKVFSLRCKLRKHMNNHTRPWKCEYCTTFLGGAERKDLSRHLRTSHPDRLEVRGDRTNWKEVASCERCGKEMRADNLKRHLKTCMVGRGGVRRR